MEDVAPPYPDAFSTKEGILEAARAVAEAAGKAEAPPPVEDTAPEVVCEDAPPALFLGFKGQFAELTRLWVVEPQRHFPPSAAPGAADCDGVGVADDCCMGRACGRPPAAAAEVVDDVCDEFFAGDAAYGGRSSSS